jgi:hypothetical protein
VRAGVRALAVAGAVCQNQAHMGTELNSATIIPGLALFAGYAYAWRFS